MAQSITNPNFQQPQSQQNPAAAPVYIPPPPPQVTVGGGGVNLGQAPVQMNCPSCHSDVTTETLPVSGLFTYLVSGGICLLGCWAGCCLIPCFLDDCKDIEHRCPNCKHLFGVYKKIK